MLPPSGVITKFRVDGKIGNMLWKSSPIPMYQFIWYTPGTGEGHSWTLHRNYLLPINSNIGQDEKDAPMTGVENNNPSTLAPPVDSEPADAGPSRMVTSSAAASMPQGSLDQTAPLRCSVQKTWSWLLWRYRILVSWQIPVHPASGMHGLVCESVSMSYSVSYHFLEKYSGNNTLLIPPHACHALLHFDI